jgi:putative peptidoglycan lipid II flippase
MAIRDIFFSKSAIDFLFMFCSNIIKKLLGFVREVILASIFGSSIQYAHFLLLRTVPDLFSQLTEGNALQANLLPKFTKLYCNFGTVSLVRVFSFSKGILWKFFLVSQLLQLPIIYYLESNNYFSLIIISILLGIVECTNFYNTIFLTIMQSQGKFKLHSIATTLNLFVSTMILYPLAFLFNIIGTVISRLIGVLVLNFTYIKPMREESYGEEARLQFKDFNLPIMILGNFANIIILLSRFVSGSDGSSTITHFTYATILLNGLFTAVMVNLNTLLLKRLTIIRDIRLVIFTVLFSILLCCGLIYFVDIFSLDIIRIIFQRGVFSQYDVIESASYMRELSKGFLFIFIASVLFQPFFSMEITRVRYLSKFMARYFIAIALILFVVFYFNNWDVRYKSIVMFYTMSFFSMLLSFCAMYFYINSQKNDKI